MEKNNKGYLYRKQTFLYNEVEVKKDCTYYQDDKNDCDCLTCLLCKEKKCSFYRPKK